MNEYYFHRAINGFPSLVVLLIIRGLNHRYKITLCTAEIISRDFVILWYNDLIHETNSFYDFYHWYNYTSKQLHEQHG